uniref:Protein phosphatase 1 regulatory subunit 11 n=1 Tax=Caenorhabditis tropicalis TaxID=1561998 RepID=A0A1I7TGI1_9PELO
MATTTTVVTVEDQNPPEQLVLRLRAPSSPPHVTWAADVIDNEHMGRLKSNCCCIYVAPRRWDDPSTWEPDEHETEHCRGHTELKKPKGEEPKKDDGCGCDHSHPLYTPSPKKVGGACLREASERGEREKVHTNKTNDTSKEN